jgi:hypothetical protein
MQPVGQRKARTALVAARQKAAEALALKGKRGGVQARVAIEESEAMPLRFAAEMLLGGDSELAIRILIVLSCDPLTLALTAAPSARRTTV